MYAFLACCLVAYVISQIARGGGHYSRAIDGWGVAVFEVLASSLCLLNALVDRKGRVISAALGAGLLSWSLGDIVLTIESAGGATPPVPSLADVFYLTFYPVTYVALMLLMRRHVIRFSVATWLDGAVAGLGAAAVCAAFAFRSLIQYAGGSAGEVATNLAYPIGDLALLAMVMAGTAVLPGRKRPPWLMLAAGYSLNAAGDTFNLFQNGIGHTEVGVMFNAVAWPTSILLISAAVWLRSSPSREIKRDSPPGFLLPGLATIAAVLILLVGSLTHGGRVAVGLATATLATVGVRFALSLLSLRGLTEQRRRDAETDQLTGLGNRRALFARFEDVLPEAVAAEDEHALAFLFVDLNRFKEVNDSFGHSAGDELLRQLGERLRGSLRSSDLLVRLGGDEFAVVLPGADTDYAAHVAARIGAKVEEPFLLGAVRARISASIGIAAVPADATTAADLLRCADLAMYRAKLEGKCFAIYQEEIDGGGNRMRLVEELRLAIEQRELELHYQPQLELGTGRIVAVEALVRWPHPRLGLVPPLEFLSLAEEADLMGPLTRIVLEKALAQCVAWRAAGHTLTVSVNVSATNLLDPSFTELVAELLAEYGLAPSALVLEITETTAIANFDRSQQVIEQLRDLGAVVSVDDFGAGFTSLAYLSGLAVGELKLDRSFISGLATPQEGRDVPLVRATIELAHALRLRVVAEGVEDTSSLELLASLGCDLAQGYVIGKPVPAGELRFAPPFQATVAAAAARLAA